MDIEHNEIRLNGRSVPISRKLNVAMRDWLIVREQYSTSDKSDRVFVSRDAGSISRFTLDATVKRYLKRAVIRDHSSHSFRHTFARRLVEMGVWFEDVAKVLGIDVPTVVQLYAVTGNVSLSDAMKRLD